MRTGLTSVTFRNKSCDEIIEIAKKSNLQGIEWGADVHVPVGNLEFANEVSEKCAKNNIDIFSYGSYYKCKKEQDFAEVLDTAKALGAPIIRVWAGGKSPFDINEKEFEFLVTTLKKNCDLAKEKGIKIALEYHRGTMTQTKEGTLKLLNAVDNDNLYIYWQANPDISFEEQILEIETLKKYICTYHVFAWEKGNERFLISDFYDKWQKYIELTSDINYVIEFVKDDSEQSLKEDAKTLNKLVSDKIDSRKNAIFICGENFAFDVYDSDSLEKLDKMFKIPRIVITSQNYKEHKELLKNTEYIFSTWGMIVLTEEEIDEYLPNLKAIFYGAGTVQRFAKPFLQKSIPVFSAWAANAIPVAEYTVAQIVLATKGYFQNMRRYRNFGREVAVDYFREQEGNYNVKIGILGAGMIGKRVMKMLQSYQLDVLVCDPFLSEEDANLCNAKKVEMNEIFEKCLVISNHTANLPATIGLITYEQFKRMKKNATFINTGRPKQIVEDDMIRALKEENNRTALLDVEEPQKGNPLLEMENVFLTSHIAGSSGKELARMGEYMLDQCEKFLKGEKCEYEVTLKMLETMA
ncbi:MAG: NAD(P)-dependent oxidoreductase [Clostridia bacterium]